MSEVSYPSTGLGIELGWADAFSTKLLAFHQAGTQPSASLACLEIELLAYENKEELILKTISCLAKYQATDESVYLDRLPAKSK